MPKVGLLFPGQGSQFAGMGKELCESFATAKAVYNQADVVLGFSLSRIMLEGPEETLQQTDIAQPAIFTAAIAAYAVLRETVKFDPSYIICAGHSSGEYSALYAAGVFNFESGLRLVRRRGQLMQAAAEKASGSMAAVIGKNESEVRELCQKADAEGRLQVANLNSPGQIVISGSNQALEAFNTIALEQNIRVISLTVSGPFHSCFMQPAADKLAEDFKNVVFHDAQFPVIANVSAEPITAARDIRASLLQQVTGSVRWEQSMQKMYSLGVAQMIEIGPGRVLRGLMRKINSQVKVRSAFQPAEIETLADDFASVQTAGIIIHKS